MDRTMENANTQNLLQLHVQAAVQLANLCNMGSYPPFPPNTVWPFPSDSSCFKHVQGLNSSVAVIGSNNLGSPGLADQQQMLTALAPLHNLQVKSPIKKSSCIKNRLADQVGAPLIAGVAEKNPRRESSIAETGIAVKERKSKRPATHPKSLKRPKRSRTEWSKGEIIVLLQCARLMTDFELKAIVRVVYSYTKRMPGKCWGRAAEKKLKRLVNFRNWKTCDKREVLRQVELRLRELGAEHTKIDPKLEELINFYTNRNNATSKNRSC